MNEYPKELIDAQTEAFEVQDHAKKDQEQRGETGELSSDDYKNAEASLEQKKIQKSLEDADKLGAVRQKLGIVSENSAEEQEQEQLVRGSQELIHTMGGKIDPSVAPYKSFNLRKHERFLIQKGEFHNSEVVFKVGQEKDEKTIHNESRNLRVIEEAPVKSGQNVDVHFVRQIGDIYKDEKMLGLATEYIQDDRELKRSLSSQQKVNIIGRTIENLQCLSVTDQARESGMPVHDGEKIVHDAQYFLDTLLKEGRLDAETVGRLQESFRSALPSLSAEQLFFVHGDAHGDNIFIKQNDVGEIDISLLDFEGLRISNQYHDWSEILNKAAFLKRVQANRPEAYEPIKKNVEDMWLDESVVFDEQAIIEKISGGDPDKARNFRLTKAYDMLMRIMNDRSSGDPMAKERVALYLEQLQKEA